MRERALHLLHGDAERAQGRWIGSHTELADLPADDWRHNDPRYSAENLPTNLKVVDAIGVVAARHGVSKAQVALAWLLAQGDDIVPIPGTKRRATMADSVGAVDVVLSADDLATIDAASPRGATATEATYALIEAGAKRVKVVTLARAANAQK